jgi:hypothetical protein
MLCLQIFPFFTTFYINIIVLLLLKIKALKMVLYFYWKFGEVSGDTVDIHIIRLETITIAAGYRILLINRTS